MEILEKSFVRDLCSSLRSEMSQEIWNHFESSPNSGKLSYLVQYANLLERIEFHVKNLLEKHSDPEQMESKILSENIERILNGWDFRKSKSKALVLKEAGNQAFRSGSNEKALDFYSTAIAFMKSSSDSTDLAILHANRSAPLFHLGLFSWAQSDIDLALRLKYPPELHYKLYERSGRCFAKEGKNPEASRRFQQAIKSLSHPLLNLNSERREKVKTTLEKLLKSSTGSGFGFMTQASTEKENTSSNIPTTAGGRGKYLRNASSKLSLMKSESEGRYVVANENINPGEIIVVEKAYVSALGQEAYHRQCFQCYSMLGLPIPCSRCALISFCSEKCRDLAWSMHHKFECDILGILRLAGVSITCLMALRVLTQKTFSEIRKWDVAFSSEEVEATSDTPAIKKTNGGNWRDFQYRFKDEFRPDHISSVLKLVTHDSQRGSKDYFPRIITAIFLVSLLKRTTFFENSGTQEESKLSQESKPTETPNEGTIIFVGSILLRILQTLQFNAHEISGWDPSVSKSCFIGGGLFPTLAFFNHSCNPAIVRYFVNDTVVVRTVRTIQRGEPVTENYGPIFTQSGRSERQAYLKSRYLFHCQCIPCLEDWPLFSNLSKDNMSFRCRNCRAYLCKTDTESFNLLLRCARCLKPTNMLQSLKSLEKSDSKFNQAMEFMSKGRLETAVGILLENMILFDSVLLPPFPDYHWCQEGLRKCYLPLGNQSNSLKIRSGVPEERSGVIVS